MLLFMYVVVTVTQFGLNLRACDDGGMDGRVGGSERSRGMKHRRRGPTTGL